MAVVNHQPEAGMLDARGVHVLEEARAIALHGVCRVGDRADGLRLRTAEILAEEERLDLALGVLGYVPAVLVEEARLDHTAIVRIEAHVHAAAEVLAGTYVVAQHGHGQR